jgi:nucleotide-binding universal stress UspA family protein
MIALEDLLCATDSSELSSHTFACVRQLSSWCGAKESRLHVVPDPVPILPAAGAAPPPAPMDDEPSRRAELEGLAREALEAGLRVETLLAKGQPATQIAAHAEQHRCDLIVVGTHGRRGVRRRPLASRLTLLHVLEPLVPEGAGDLCRPQTRVVRGRPWSAVVAEAARAGLVVMGARERRSLERLLFGSTARAVTRHATCPVLAARPHAAGQPAR